MITTMKQNIKLLFAAGVIGLATSCTDLDVPVKSQYTKYPSSEVAQEAQMADVYYHLRGTLGRRYMEAQALASDEWVSISFDGDYFDGGTYAHTCLHNFYNTDPSIGWYADVASGIAKANRAIVNMGGDDADPKVIAPARAMRAFYHFILMDSYGDIPVLDGIPNENEAIERKPRAEVARFIENELLDIIPYLSEANDETTYGKPNKWMAEALLVKLYINWAVYTAASVDKYDAATATNEKLNVLSIVTRLFRVVSLAFLKVLQVIVLSSSLIMAHRLRILSMQCLIIQQKLQVCNMVVLVLGDRQRVALTVIME